MQIIKIVTSYHSKAKLHFYFSAKQKSLQFFHYVTKIVMLVRLCLLLLKDTDNVLHRYRCVRVDNKHDEL